MDAAITTPEEHFKKFHNGSRFRNTPRLSPQYFQSRVKITRNIAGINIRERQQTLGTIMQENAMNVNHMISRNITSSRFHATKLKLMANNGQFFHDMLDVKNNQGVLPDEIGNFYLFITQSLINSLALT